MLLICHGIYVLLRPDFQDFYPGGVLLPVFGI